MDRQPTKPVEKDYPVPFSTDIPFFNLSLGTYNYPKPTTEPSQEPSRPARAEGMTPFHKGFDEFVRARKNEKRAAERMEREALGKKQRLEVQAQKKAAWAAKAKPASKKPTSAKPAGSKPAGTRLTDVKPANTKPTPLVRYVRVKQKPVNLAGWCGYAKNGLGGSGAGVLSGRIEKRRDNGGR